MNEFAKNFYGMLSIFTSHVIRKLIAKLSPDIRTACRNQPSPHVELTCLQGLADLEQLEGPWAEILNAGDPEGAAFIIRLLMALRANNADG